MAPARYRTNPLQERTKLECDLLLRGLAFAFAVVFAVAFAFALAVAFAFACASALPLPQLPV